MFSKEIYNQRREVLRSKIGQGVILLPGNGESPSNYPNNTFHFRQVSTFLDYFGQNHPELAGVIDCESGEAYKFEDGEKISVNSGVWLGEDLPVIRPGYNYIMRETATMPNIRVIPRWWTL